VEKEVFMEYALISRAPHLFKDQFGENKYFIAMNVDGGGVYT